MLVRIHDINILKYSQGRSITIQITINFLGSILWISAENLKNIHIFDPVILLL